MNSNLKKEEFAKAPFWGFGGIKEAIILAGGSGTRLKEAIPDLPKCLAPVNGRPFLFYVINYLRSQGIEKFIFSLGYKHEVVEAYLQTEFPTLDFQCLIEKDPLGTGGAILASCYKTAGQTVLVVNGDTIFKADIEKAFADDSKTDSDCTLLLNPMENFDRYGVVELNEDDTIKSFEEKKQLKEANTKSLEHKKQMEEANTKSLEQKKQLDELLEANKKKWSKCLLFNF